MHQLQVCVQSLGDLLGSTPIPAPSFKPGGGGGGSGDSSGGTAGSISFNHIPLDPQAAAVLVGLLVTVFLHSLGKVLPGVTGWNRGPQIAAMAMAIGTAGAMSRSRLAVAIAGFLDEIIKGFAGGVNGGPETINFFTMALVLVLFYWPVKRYMTGSTMLHKAKKKSPVMMDEGMAFGGEVSTPRKDKKASEHPLPLVFMGVFSLLLGSVPYGHAVLSFLDATVFTAFCNSITVVFNVLALPPA